MGREEQHRRMGRGHEQFGDRVLVLGRHAGAALAAATLCAEGVERGALDIAAMGDGHDHLGAFHQIFVLEAIPGSGDFGEARRGKFVANLFQLFAHHCVEFGAVRQYGEIFLDRGSQFLQFISNFLATECGQLLQTQIEDCFYLDRGQLVTVALNVGFHRFDQPDIGRNLGNRPFAAQQRFAGFDRR